MKRTTYIMAAMFASGMILMFALMSYIALTGTPRNHNKEIYINGDIKTVHITDDFTLIKLEDNTRGFFHRNFPINIIASNDSCTSLSYGQQWDKYLSYSSKNDTLTIAIDFSELDDLARDIHSDSTITIAVPQSKCGKIHNNIDVNLDISNFSQGHLNILSYTDRIATLSNCVLSKLAINNCKFNLSGCTVDTMFTDIYGYGGDWGFSYDTKINHISVVSHEGNSDAQLLNWECINTISVTTDSEHPGGFGIVVNEPSDIKVTPDEIRIKIKEQQ